MPEVTKLTRDCAVILVPYGTPMTLPAGTTVYIMQSLGGDFTVTTNMGYMARVSGKDAEALGKEIPAEFLEVQKLMEAAATGEALSAEETEKRVWAQLKTCYDPEIPVNIVDLGLVYVCKLEPHPESGFKVLINMTVTAPGCNMGGVIAGDAQKKILGIPGIREALVNVVFEPPWNQAMMTEAAKLQLGML